MACGREEQGFWSGEEGGDWVGLGCGRKGFGVGKKEWIGLVWGGEEGDNTNMYSLSNTNMYSLVQKSIKCEANIYNLTQKVSKWETSGVQMGAKRIQPNREFRSRLGTA